MLKYLLPAVLAMFHFSCHAVDCREEFEKHLKTDLRMPYEEFDQTLGKGMRPLANAGCHKEAADLIVRYVDANNDKHKSLVWHIAQQRALQDDTGDAIKYAKQSLLENEDFAKKPLRWNDFVLAHIAFLKKDRQSFDQHKAVVEKAKDTYFGNALNLKLLEELSLHFEKNYKDALADIED